MPHPAFSWALARQWISQVLRNCLNVRAVRSFFGKAHADRGKERYRRASLTASTSILSQALAVLSSIISVPLTVHYLGPERYGVWLTISSLITWMTVTDFGLTGNALVNLIAEASGKDDRNLARQYASSTFWTLIAITTTIAATFVLLFGHIPWQTVFRVSAATSLDELRAACALALAIFVLTLPLNMLTAVYNAYQDGFVANLWTIAANAIALVSLIVVTQFHGGLPNLVVALSGTRVVVGIANGCYLFFYRYRWLRPRISAVRWRHIRRLLSLGSKYMVGQLAALGVGQSQPMIITQVLGPSYVPIFVIAHRLITMPQTLVYIATAPFVSAYSEAKARGDWQWIRSAVKNATIVSLAVGLALVMGLAVASKPIIRLWAGPATVPDAVLVIWLSAYTVLGIAVNPSAQMLWGLERVGIPVLALAACAVLTVKLEIVFARWWGLSGLSAAMTVSFLFYCFIQAYEVRRALASLRLDAVSPGEGCAIETSSA